MYIFAVLGHLQKLQTRSMVSSTSKLLVSIAHKLFQTWRKEGTVMFVLLSLSLFLSNQHGENLLSLLWRASKTSWKTKSEK